MNFRLVFLRLDSNISKKPINFKQNKIFLIFDDRNKVVKMWRELGLPVFQVAEGDF